MESFKTLLLGTPPTRTYTASATGLLTSANNLSDVADAATSRTNLGLGTTTTAFNSITAAAATNLTLAGGSSGASLVLGQGANGDVTITPQGTGRITTAASYSSTKLSSAASASQTWANYSLQLIAAQSAGQHTASIGWAENNAQNVSSAITGVDWGGGGAHGIAFWTGNVTTLSRSADITNTGNLLIGGTTDISGSGGLKIFGTTAATSTTTGAFQCAGGGSFVKELVAGLGLWLVDGQSAPGATVGYAKLYVDTADGDLKVVFGDGTIKTIATDT